METKIIEVKLTREEHCMITAILMMHHTGLIVNIHKDNSPLLDKLAQRFSLENIRFMLIP